MQNWEEEGVGREEVNDEGGKVEEEEEEKKGNRVTIKKEMENEKEQGERAKQQ